MVDDLVVQASELKNSIVHTKTIFDEPPDTSASEGARLAWEKYVTYRYLEMLSPITPMASEFADRPVTPVNNELIKDMSDLLFPLRRN